MCRLFVTPREKTPTPTIPEGRVGLQLERQNGGGFLDRLVLTPLPRNATSGATPAKVSG